MGLPGRRPFAALMAGAAAVIAPGPLLAQQPSVTLPPVEVIGASPLIGSGIDRNAVPAATHVLDGRDLSRQGPADLLGSLNREIGGANLNSASGNPFQPSLYYRGFAAAPCRARRRVSRSTSTACAST